MSKLWEPNPKYDPSKPQSWDNMPYKRLYWNLTPEELAELLQDAKRLQWEVLDLSHIYVDFHSLENLSNLQAGTFKLENSNINILPDSIGDLSNLQALDLEHSNINVLPDSIRNLKKLKTLRLCYCHLKGMPHGVVDLGLPFVIDDNCAENCVNLTGTTLEYGNLNVFAHSREPSEIYRETLEQALEREYERNYLKMLNTPFHIFTPIEFNDNLELESPQPAPTPEPTPPPAPVPKPTLTSAPKPESPPTQQNFRDLSNQIEELRRHLSESERRNAYRTGIKIAVGVGTALALLLFRHLNWFDWLIELFDLLT